MSFLSKILNREVKGRFLGKLAPYSISFTNCNFQWERSSSLVSYAKIKVDNIDSLYFITPHLNPIKCDSFIRIFVFKETPPRISTTFDITTIDNLESEVINIQGNNASRVMGVKREKLEDDRYYENVMVHTKIFSILFELYIGNNNEPLKEKIISDFLGIVNSLKISVD